MVALQSSVVRAAPNVEVTLTGQGQVQEHRLRYMNHVSLIWPLAGSSCATIAVQCSTALQLAVKRCFGTVLLGWWTMVQATASIV